MHALWGMGQLMFTKCVVVVDKDVNVHDLAEVGWRVLNNIDPKRDVMISDGPYDVLDHASCTVGFGGKLGVDATAKWKEEGYDRKWPEVAAMAPEMVARVDRLWPELGIVRK
jgi:4-hydroxy-3-polyprenylbenzoate decarboxylase